MEFSTSSSNQQGAIRPVLHQLVSKGLVPGAFLLVLSSLCGQTTPVDTEKAIKDKLATPPVFLDDQHQGPSLVPKDLPEQVVPFDCRATEAYLHEVRPGQYHYERAQRLLGLGLDIVGCEAFGLERFSKAENPRYAADKAVKEAEAAAALPIGLEQWRPGALRYILMAAYSNAADVYRKYAKAHKSVSDESAAALFGEKFREVKAQKDDALPQSPSKGRTPLIDAVLKNDQVLASRLLQAGEDVNATDADHTTALRVAVAIGSMEMVRLLLDHGAKAGLSDEEGLTALMVACAVGRSRIVVALLAAGVDPNARADDGSTALLDTVTRIVLPAGRQSRRQLIHILLDDKAQVNAADWEGVTPVIAAARTGDDELTSMLLEAGADLESSDQEGRTPLLEAIDKDNVEVVRLLLSKHARVSVFDKNGRSPLTMAAGRGYPEGAEITKLLLISGADANLANSVGWTPLMAAEGFVFREPWGVSSHVITKELLACGANASARSKAGKTPLITAAGQYNHDDPSFLQELIDAGADVNAADADGQTALMAAAEKGHVSKVRFLLGHGANVNARDKWGRTALQYARPPKNDRDDDFPQCYDSVNSDDLKPNNSCDATRRLLKSRM